MSKSPLVLIVVAIMLLGFVAPTGASSGDHLWTDPNVVLAPGTGPGGDYATLNAEGELEVDLSSPGVNAGAMTTIDGVFTVSNEDQDTVGIWFSHNETDEVVLSVDGRSAQEESDPIILSPGEEVPVDLSVDSSSRLPGELVLSEFTIHAENETATETSSGGDGTTTSSSGVVDDTTDDGSVEEDDDLPPPSGEDEVIYADGPEPAAVFTSLDPSTADEIDAGPGLDRPPRPAIEAVTPPRHLGSNPVPSADGTDALVSVGDPFVLSADRSQFDTVAAIQPDGEPARVVDVEVPTDRADERAVLRLAVHRDRLNGADPSSARIARHTDGGWQLLSTSVVEADDERVVLEAITPGTSAFAVFSDPAVTYEWRFPDGQTARGSTVTERFESPGSQAVTLTVTDAFGRTATTEYRMLANDRPTVSIDAPSDIGPGDMVELTADVTNEVGEVTVRWQFGDGTVVAGPSIERSFPAGEQTVRVVVTDEYGAQASASATLTVGNVARVSRAAIELAQLGLNLEIRLLITALALMMLLVGLREWAATRPTRSRARQVR